MSSVASSSHVLRSAPQANSIANAVVDMELDGGDDIVVASQIGDNLVRVVDDEADEEAYAEHG